MTEASDRKALKVLLFVLVLLACAAGFFVGVFAGWKAGAASLVLLMLPAVAIYRFAGVRGAEGQD